MVDQSSGPQQTVGRYTVVPRTLIFLKRDEHVLLMRGGAHKWFAGRYNGLGGHVEPGEDVYTAALREVQEEAGVRPEALTLRAVVHVVGFDPGVLLFVFCGTLSAEPVAASAEGTLEWVPLERLDHYPLLPDLRWLLPRALDSTVPLLFATFDVGETTITVRTAEGEEAVLSRL